MGEGSPQRTRRTLALGLCAAALALGALYAATRQQAPAPETAPASVAKAPPTETEETAKAEPSTETSDTAPAFDVVRVEPDGATAVVGTAEPGAMVTIYADRAPVAEAEADAGGNFVALFEVEPSAQPRSLSLEARGPEGGAERSEDVVMLLPRAPGVPGGETDPAAPESVPAVARPPVAAAKTEPGEVEPATKIAVAEPAAEAPAAAVVATAIIRGGSVDVTPAAVPEGDGATGVALGSISYGEVGQVTLSGAGAVGSAVRVYVDDRFDKEVAVGPEGRWEAELADVAEGIYQLRIDEVGAAGAVTSRVETPFQRDYPRPPRSRPGGGPVEEAAVTVQPGNNLWTLARTHYGSGVMYTQIFTANQDLIRDPDLIYPGQIFRMPSSIEVE